MTKKIPKNWQIKKLGEVCKLIKGKKPKTFSNSGKKYLTAKVIRGTAIPEYTEDKKAVYIKKKDIIIIMDGSNSGEMFQGLDGALASTMGVLDYNKDEFDNKFLLYFLIGFRENFTKSRTGSAIPHLNKDEFNDLPLPIISKQEQIRITKILDEAFEKLEIAKNNAAKNLVNAKELFESYLQNIFENGGDDWTSDILKNLTTKIGSGATPRGGKNAYHTEGLSLIRSLNIYDYEFRKNKLAFIDESQADKLANVTLEKQDILLNITGASVARCCIVPTSVLPARVNQHVSIIRLKQEMLLSKFLHYLLISKPYKDSLLGIGHKGGSTRQAITKVQIQNFKINYPKSKEQQQKIVTKLDTLSNETKKLEKIYQKKIDNLDELKKSLLQKAFAGEL